MTPADFKIRFPAFVAEPEARVQMFIDDADPAFNVCYWGGFYEVGLANYVAHNLAIANYLATVGSSAAKMSTDTIEKKVDMVSVKKSEILINAAASNPYMRTQYGQQYLYYLDLIGVGAVAV